MYSFHNTLSGHSMNYISRGTYSGSEQRAQLDYRQGGGTGITGGKYRNYECGIGGEDCSLCVVSAIPSSYWIRWMLVSDSPDASMLYLARGAPRRWYQDQGSGAAAAESFGITNATTRFGIVSFTMHADVTEKTVSGIVSLDRYARTSRPAAAAAAAAAPLSVSVKVRSSQQSSHGSSSGAAPKVTVTTGAVVAKFVTWHPRNETAVFELTTMPSGSALIFSFEATF